MFLKRLSFQFLLFLCSLGLRLTHMPHPQPHSPSAVFLGASFTGPQSLLGRGAWQPWACVTSTRQGLPPLPQGLYIAEDRADAILVGTQAYGTLEVVTWVPESSR